MTNYLTASLTPDTIPKDALDAALSVVKGIPEDRFRGGFNKSCEIPQDEHNALVDLVTFVRSTQFIYKLRDEAKDPDLAPGSASLSKRDARAYPSMMAKIGGYGDREAAFKAHLILSGSGHLEVRGTNLKVDLDLAPGAFVAVKPGDGIASRFVVKEPITSLEIIFWSKRKLKPGKRKRGILMGAGF